MSEIAQLRSIGQSSGEEPGFKFVIEYLCDLQPLHFSKPQLPHLEDGDFSKDGRKVHGNWSISSFESLSPHTMNPSLSWGCFEGYSEVASVSALKELSGKYI